MEKAEYLFETLANLLWGDWLLAALLGLGIFYTLLTGCIQFRFVWLLKKGLFRLSRGKQETRDGKNALPIRRSVQLLQAVWEAEISSVYRRLSCQEGPERYFGCGWLLFLEWPLNLARL